jgi:putative phosphoribosyl transferase
MDKLIENTELRNRISVFTDRCDAGLQLAEKLGHTVAPDTLVLAIPSGGVPVGQAIAESLKLELDLVLVRKVQIPWNTEAGFAAVNMDSDLFINEHLLSMLNLSEEQIRHQVEKTMATIEKRNLKFRQNKPLPDVGGRPVMLVDDGLASGYTMRAAIAYIRKRNPDAITMAVPTGSAATVTMLLEEVDLLCCLNIREFYPFAVAAAYRNWYDLEDEDVLRLLKKR